MLTFTGLGLFTALMLLLAWAVLRQLRNPVISASDFVTVGEATSATQVLESGYAAVDADLNEVAVTDALDADNKLIGTHRVARKPIWWPKGILQGLLGWASLVVLLVVLGAWFTLAAMWGWNKGADYLKQADALVMPDPSLSEKPIKTKLTKMPELIKTLEKLGVHTSRDPIAFRLDEDLLLMSKDVEDMVIEQTEKEINGGKAVKRVKYILAITPNLDADGTRFARAYVKYNAVVVEKAEKDRKNEKVVGEQYEATAPVTFDPAVWTTTKSQEYVDYLFPRMEARLLSVGLKKGSTMPALQTFPFPPAGINSEAKSSK